MLKFPNRCAPAIVGRRVEAVDVHARPLQVLDRRGDVARVSVRQEVVAAHARVRVLVAVRLADVEQVDRLRAHLRVVLELAARALVDGLLPLLDPVRHQPGLLGCDRVHRLVDREVVVVDLLAVVLVVPFSYVMPAPPMSRAGTVSPYSGTNRSYVL